MLKKHAGIMGNFTQKATLFIVIGSLFFIHCSTWNRAMTGGLIGAGTGGLLGGVIGRQMGNTAAGAIIGAAVGGAAGSAIGHYMDKQAAELRRDLTNARVERVGEGIKITFNSALLFDIDSDRLKQNARENVTDLARVLNKYKDTNILVEGHTDNTGARSYNQNLSENRAESVARQLKSQGVVGGRITTVGYGEDQPTADNGSVNGRKANRRVEVAIFANEKLKRAALENKLI
ncbi:MAG: OmpA family protein [Chitinivibrionales bacterium]|nr:OmpA family protein [Chitinivibrionales bacterium]